MSESSQQERTESASPKRRREARERGQIPRSRELTTAAVTLGGATMMLSLGGGIAQQTQQLMHDALSFDAAAIENASALPAQLGHVLAQALWLAAPLFGGLALLALGSTLLIGGWNFSTQAITPDLTRLNPATGLGRMFSSHSLIELAKGLAKFGVVGLVAWIALWKVRGELMGLGIEPARQGITHGASLCLHVFAWLAAGLLLIAAVDVPWQLWSYEKKLRMSKQELRDEYKQSEGRPEVKARIRRVQQEMSRRRMMDKVPKADVIITNPTHYAVALQYTAGKSRAPKVLAKGADEIALAIRALGREHRIPLVEAPPLARALYRNCELDTEIPVNLYTAVAQILTYVYQLRAHRTGPMPSAPQVGDVPGGEVDTP